LRIFWYLLIAGSLLVALATGLQLFAFNTLLDAHFKQGTRNQGELLGSLMADSLSEKLLDGHKLEIRQMLHDVVENEDWVAYLYLTDFDGRLAAHSFDKGFPVALLPRLAESADYSIRRYEGERAPINDLAVPLIPGMKAMLHVGIDEQPLGLLSRNLLRQVFLLSLGVLLFSILLWLLLSRRIALPLGSSPGRSPGAGASLKSSAWMPRCGKPWTSDSSLNPCCSIGNPICACWWRTRRSDWL